MRAERKRGQSGAILMVAAFFFWVLVIAVLAAGLEGQAAASYEHAVSAAQAVAHGVAVAANSDADSRERLSTEALAGRDCFSGPQAPPQNEQADTDLCQKLFAEASHLAVINGVTVIQVIVGPKLDGHSATIPGFLDVLVEVQGKATFPGAHLTCPNKDPNTDHWCPPQVFGAAQISG